MSALLSGTNPLFDDDSLNDLAGAVGTFDFQYLLPVPFCAIGKQNAAEDMARRTLLPAALFANPLEVIITTGGNDSIIDRAATSTVTMTAYGSATGSPTAEIHRVVVRKGEAGAVRGQKYLCQKYRQGPYLIPNAQTNALIGRLNVGNLYSRLILRVGDLNSDSDPALGNVSNTGLPRYYLRLGPQQTIRDKQFLTGHFAQDWFEGHNEFVNGWRNVGIGITAGVGLFEFPGHAIEDFCEDGVLESALNTLLWGAGGRSLELWGDVVAGTLQQVDVITEALLPRSA
jgi:hypothetical protein